MIGRPKAVRLSGSSHPSLLLTVTRMVWECRSHAGATIVTNGSRTRAATRNSPQGGCHCPGSDPVNRCPHADRVIRYSPHCGPFVGRLSILYPPAEIRKDFRRLAAGIESAALGLFPGGFPGPRGRGFDVRGPAWGRICILYPPATIPEIFWADSFPRDSRDCNGPPICSNNVMARGDRADTPRV